MYFLVQTGNEGNAFSKRDLKLSFNFVRMLQIIHTLSITHLKLLKSVQREGRFPQCWEHEPVFCFPAKQWPVSLCFLLALSKHLARRLCQGVGLWAILETYFLKPD